jgi:ketosteroid isomerase-like protein
MARDLDVVVRRWFRITPRGAVYFVSQLGQTSDGARFENAFLALVRLRDGLITRYETFGIDQLDEALAAFDRTEAPATIVGRVINRLGAAIRRRDWDAYRAFMRDDIVIRDRRAVFGTDIVGVAEAERNSQTMYELGLTDTVAEGIAMRGEHLELMRIRWFYDRGDTEVQSLLLVEADDDGLMSAMTLFDADDLATALVVMEDRYEELVGADDAMPAAMRGLLSGGAIGHRYTDDFVGVDHRPLVGTGPLDRDAWLERSRAFVDLLSTIVLFTARVFRRELFGMVTLTCVAGTNTEGGRFEVTLPQVTIFDGDKIKRIERFAEGQLDDALRRFDELAPTPPLDLENVAVRTQRRGIDGWADDATLHDRRQGFGFTITGKAEIFEHSRALPLPVAAFEPLAVRGERLALYRVVRTGDVPHGLGDAEVTFLTLHELDDAGLIAEAVMFDADDFGAAIAELDSRFLDGEGAHDPVLEWIAKSVLWFRTDDWDGYRALYSEDFEFVDRGPYKLGVRNRDELADMLHRFRQTAPQMMNVVAKIVERRDNGAIYVARIIGPGLAGDLADTLRYAVVTFRDGVCTRTESFASDALDDARNRLDELLATGDDAAAADERYLTPFQRACREIRRAFSAGDVGALEWCFGDDMAGHDHIQHVAFDRATYLDMSRRVARMPGVRTSYESVLDFGWRHGVVRWRYEYPAGAGSAPWSDVGGGESTFLIVFRTDQQGRVVIAEHFAVDDLLSAIIRLEELYSAGEGAGEELAGSLRRQHIWRFLASYNRDWDALAACLDPAIESVDHRPTGFGVMHGAPALVATMRSVANVSEDARYMLDHVHLLTGDAVVAAATIRGRDLEGGDFERPIVVYARVGDAGIVRFEAFAEDALEAALAAAAADDPRLTPFQRACRNLQDAVNNDDIELLVRTIHDDVRVHDNINHVILDQLEYLDVGRRMARMPGVHSACVPLIELGLRHGIYRWESSYPRGAPSGPWSDVSGGEMSFINAIRTDEDGRLLAATNFADDDLLGALIRLEEMYVEDEATGDALAGSRRRARGWHFAQHYNRDWDAVLASFDPDVVYTDHRPNSYPTTRTAEAFVALMRTQSPVSADAQPRVQTVHLTSDDAVVMSLVIAGHDQQGGEFESPMVLYLALGDNGITKCETFSIDEVDAALTAAHEARLTPFERTCRAMQAAMHAGDADGIADCFDAAVVVADHINHLELDKAGYVDIALRLIRMPGVTCSYETLASLGARHGIARWTYVHPAGAAGGPWADVGGGETSFIAAIRTMPDATVLRTESFPPDDLVAAMMRLEEMFAEDEATGDALAGSLKRRHVWRFLSNYNRDWDVVAGCLDAAVAAIDHRPTGFGQMPDAASLVDTLRSVGSVSEDAQLVLEHIHLLTADAVVIAATATGHDREGGEFERPVLLCIRVGDNGITRYEVFAPDEIDAALAAAQSIV